MQPEALAAFATQLTLADHVLANQHREPSHYRELLAAPRSKSLVDIGVEVTRDLPGASGAVAPDRLALANRLVDGEDILEAVTSKADAALLGIEFAGFADLLAGCPIARLVVIVTSGLGDRYNRHEVPGMAVLAVMLGIFYVQPDGMVYPRAPMPADRDLGPGEEWRSRPGVLRQGGRFGAIGCVGCLTFTILAVAIVIVVGFLTTAFGLHEASKAANKLIPPVEHAPTGTTPEKAPERRTAQKAASHAEVERRRAEQEDHGAEEHDEAEQRRAEAEQHQIESAERSRGEAEARKAEREAERVNHEDNHRAEAEVRRGEAEVAQAAA